MVPGYFSNTGDKSVQLTLNKEKYYTRPKTYLLGTMISAKKRGKSIAK
jgi:hypothetical protein